MGVALTQSMSKARGLVNLAPEVHRATECVYKLCLCALSLGQQSKGEVANPGVSLA